MSSMLLCGLAEAGYGGGGGRDWIEAPRLERSERLANGGGSSCRRWHVREKARTDCWRGRMERDESSEVVFASRRVVVGGVIFEALTAVRLVRG